MYILCFIQVTKPIVSSWTILFQVEQTNNMIALTVFMFILNILVEQTKLQNNGCSISNRNLTITLSIAIYDSGQYSHYSSKLWLTLFLTSMEFEIEYVHRIMYLRRYIWRFLSKIECCNVVSEGILKFLPLFTFMLFNNNTYLTVHSFTFYLLYKHQFSVTNLMNYSCASFVSSRWHKQRVCLNKWCHLNGKHVNM